MTTESYFLPWRVERHTDIWGACGPTGSMKIATTSGIAAFDVANAAYIVHACNAYPELVSAIEYAVQFGEAPLNYPVILKRLRTALANTRDE